jgi:predicted O-methyltransferase YrrM
LKGQEACHAQLIASGISLALPARDHGQCAEALMTYSSIYDLSPEFLLQFDWSRPLIVQACRTPFFCEAIDVLVTRLDLKARDVTILSHPDYRPQADWTGRHLVNPPGRISPETARNPGIDPTAYSLMVVFTQATLTDSYDAWRHHSGVACFCHAMAPLPTMVVDRTGHAVSTYEGFFSFRERTVGPHQVLGSIALTAEEIRGLYESAIKRPDGAVVEIGRFAGGSAMVLAWAGRDSGRRGVISIDVERLACVDYLLAANGFTAEDITLVDAEATAVARTWDPHGHDRRVALLFIDADHSYEGVRGDLEAWMPHLAPGALVAFHDVNTPSFGVTRAVYHHVYQNAQFDAFERFDSLLIARYNGMPLLDRQAEHVLRDAEPAVAG